MAPERTEDFSSLKLPSTLAIIDTIQFCFRSVGKPLEIGYHDYPRHHHFRFNQQEGQDLFRIDINMIFARNGLAYELQADGNIKRLLPEVLRDSLNEILFHTGDSELDGLLESARRKFSSPDMEIRRDSLEKLWDAWERLKTVEPGKDKKSQIKALLDKCLLEPNMRNTIEAEALELTGIGNNYRIRHSETNRIPVSSSEQVDYLFHRMFSMIRFLLKTTGKGG